MSSSKHPLVSLMVNTAILILGVFFALLIYSLVRQAITPPISPERSNAESGPLVGAVIQIEILNGCGENGIARRATDFLRSRGFDVVEAGNYKHFDVERTIVLDRVGNIESARRVAEAVGADIENISQDLDPDLFLDASLIIGKDFESLLPFK